MQDPKQTTAPGAETPSYEELSKQFKQKLLDKDLETITVGELAERDPEAFLQLKLFNKSSSAPTVGGLEDLPDVSWGDVLKGINPIGFPRPYDEHGKRIKPKNKTLAAIDTIIPESPFWSSVARHSIDTVIGIPHMPELMVGLAKELTQLTENDAKSPKVTKYEQLLKLSPKQGPLGEPQFGDWKPMQTEYDVIEKMSEKDFENYISNKEYPILKALLQEFKQKYGSLKGFKYTLANDPFSIIIDAADAAGLAAGLLNPLDAGAVEGAVAAGRMSRIGTKAARAAKQAAKASKVIQKFTVEDWFMQGITKGLEKYSEHIKANPTAFENVEIQYGIDPDTGKPLTFTTNLRELAEKYGGVKNVPITALIGEDLPKNIEKALLSLNDSKNVYHLIVKKRYASVENAIRKVREAIVGTKYKNVWDPSETGKAVIETMKAEQAGRNTPIAEAFSKNDEILDQPVDVFSRDTPDVDATTPDGIPDDIDPTIEMTTHEGVWIGEKQILPQEAKTLFPKATEFIEKLIKDDSSTGTQLSDKQNAKVIKEISRLMNNALANPDKLTLRHIDDIRTDFHRNTDLFKRQGTLAKTGEGTSARPLYYALSDDFLDLLEKRASKNPDAFPVEFVDKVKNTRKQYALNQALEETPIAKKLRSLQDTPEKIPDYFLAKTTEITPDTMNTIKQLVGEEGLDRLRKGLLARIFSKSKLFNKVESAKSLLTELDRINDLNKNKVINLFGVDMAKTLYESANFEVRIFENGPWNTSYVNDLVSGGSLDEMVEAGGFTGYRFAEQAAKAAKATGLSKHVEGHKLGVVFGLVAWLGHHRVRRTMFSKKGQKAILEGRSITVLGKKIGARELALVSDWFGKNADLINPPVRQLARQSGRVEEKKKKLESVRTMYPAYAPRQRFYVE